jgi:secreted PhoX family phosphatase
MIHRRAVLRATSAATLGTAAAAALAVPALAQVTTLDLRQVPPLPVRLDDWVAQGYRREVLIRWGERVSYDAPPWNPVAVTPQSAASQFGWDGRIAGVVEPPAATDGVQRLVMAIVHPRADALMAWPGGRDRPDVAVAMQGATLLNLERQGARWVVVDGGFQTRRLSGEQLCRYTGPLGQGGQAQGLLGLEGGCTTPWGTLLLTEGDPTGWVNRLRGDPRFREPVRFGWAVELDPLDPQSIPAKRTALGRVGAVAAAAVRSSAGRAVVFMADGRPSGCLWRFVSNGPAGPDALDNGTLYVAREEGDALRWMPIPQSALRDPHAAADAAGASRFDGPTGLAVDPAHQRVVLACRGALARSIGGNAAGATGNANPGHVIELLGDPAADRIGARVLFLAGDQSEGGRYGRGQPPGAVPRHPATLSVDRRGRLWVGTDRSGLPGAAPDGVFATDLDGAGRSILLPVYGAPRGAGIGGAVASLEGGTLFVMVRTPGAEPGATFENPATRWPQFEGVTPPRSTLIALARADGRPVGG